MPVIAIRYIDSIYGNGDLQAIADQVLSPQVASALLSDIPAWCGQCSDSNRRQIDTDKGIARCPVCHPLKDEKRSA